MIKSLVFDMDGTIADFYNVPNWLNDLQKERTTPYKNANPIYSIDLIEILNTFQEKGVKIIIISWLAKGGSKKFNDKIRYAKKQWLKKYNFPYDKAHFIKYGTLKNKYALQEKGEQILIDDNKEVRNLWTLGGTINANENIIPSLIELLKNL